MNTNAPVKIRTLSAALEEIERLESQVIALNAALASKTTAPTKQTATAPATAPSVNQPAAVATKTPVAKSLNDMSRAELATAADQAHLRGDIAAENLYYHAHAARKPTYC
jgi:hypothetical protein